MKKFLFIMLVLAFALTSCDTIAYLQLMDGNKSGGTLTYVYEYGQMQRPIIQWEEAKKNATAKCQSWGYKGAEFFDVGQSNCVQQNMYGNCLRWRVAYKCQCTD